MKQIGNRSFIPSLLLILAAASLCPDAAWSDHVKDLQREASDSGKASWGHWGPDASKYSAWKSHSNRLTPVYTFGMSLRDVSGASSAYRSSARLQALYGQVPDGTLNPEADYCDQTDLYQLQRAAVAEGKKYVVLIVFDGMDWDMTRAAAVHRAARVAYGQGRGSGLHFQDYRGVESDFGFVVTSPLNDGTEVDVNAQIVLNPGGTATGGYDAARGGSAPWMSPPEPLYLLGKDRQRPHVVTDSSAAATSLTAGLKTYNGAVNVDAYGRPVEPLGQQLQRLHGFSIGVVTNVPISHATPACAYANNVSRSDYQDLTRDLVGLRSVMHRGEPLPGVDVLLGCGWGETAEIDKGQGNNFAPGNKYIAAADLRAIDRQYGGRYRVVHRTAGQDGAAILADAARRAAGEQTRLFGFFGVKQGHLPYQTADGQFDPTADVNPAQQYSQADKRENPSLADMTRSALRVLETDADGFWLMIEAGDVDWANHDTNIDNSIGAVLSGDDAFRAVTEWVEARNCWPQTAVIVTADHGHFLVLEDPVRLVPEQPGRSQ